MQASMLRVGFEPKTPAFKWAKTINALDRTVTVIGPVYYHDFMLHEVPTVYYIFKST
jgi:hypothetical protein